MPNTGMHAHALSVVMKYRRVTALAAARRVVCTSCTGYTFEYLVTIPVCASHMHRALGIGMMCARAYDNVPIGVTAIVMCNSGDCQIVVR